MKVSVEGPTEFQGNILSTHQSAPRHYRQHHGGDKLLPALTPKYRFREMFGYSTVLRSFTQGKAEFTMEFMKYGRVPNSLAEKLRKEYLDSKK